MGARDQRRVGEPFEGFHEGGAVPAEPAFQLPEDGGRIGREHVASDRPGHRRRDQGRDRVVPECRAGRSRRGFGRGSSEVNAVSMFEKKRIVYFVGDQLIFSLIVC